MGVGSSLGGAAALLGPAPLAVDALVLEAVYPDIGNAIANRIRAVLSPAIGATLAGLAAGVLTPMFELLLPPIIGVHPGDLRPFDRIGTIFAPVLIAAGTHDDRTTLAESRTLFERAPEPKRFWAVEGAGHVDLEACAPAEYRQRVLGFLSERLAR